MKRPIIEINFKNDFDFILTLKSKDGKEIGFPDYDFEGRITTERCRHLGSKPYVFSRRGTLETNCFNDNGKLHVVMNDHRLPPGRLFLELISYIPNPIYSDGYKTVIDKMPLMIELVEGPGDNHLFIQDEEVIVSYLYITAYQLACMSGYEGSEEEFIDALAEIGDIATLSKKSATAITCLEEDLQKFRGITRHEIDCLKKKLNSQSQSITDLTDSLHQRVANEEKRAAEAEKKLQESILAESELRAGEIQGLNNEIEELKKESANEQSSLSKDIEAETKRATEAEASITKQVESVEKEIAKESARALQAEAELEGRMQTLDNNVGSQLRSMSAEIESQKNRLDTEASARKAADELLEAQTNNLKKSVAQMQDDVDSHDSDIKKLKKDLETVNGDESVNGSIAHALNDARHYTDDKTHEVEDMVHQLDDSIKPIPLSKVKSWFKH